MIDLATTGMTIEMKNGQEYMYDTGVISSFSVISTNGKHTLMVHTFDGCINMYQGHNINSVKPI